MRLAVLGLMLAVILAWAPAALAHSDLIRSDPAENEVLDSSPAELRLWFSEAPEPSLSEVQLLDRAGQPVNGVGQLRADPADPALLHIPLERLDPGAYTVAWRTASADDGHVTSGSFAFVLGRDQVPAAGVQPAALTAGAPGDANASAADVAIRWLGYLGMSLLVGGLMFFPFVMIPASRTGPDRPRIGLPEVGGGSDEVVKPVEFARVYDLRPLLIMLVLGWAVAMLATIAGLLQEAASSAGVGVGAAVGTPVERVLAGTHYGAVFWIKTVLLEIIGGAFLLGYRAIRRGEDLALWATGLVLVALLLLATSMNSHPGTASGPPSSVPISVFVDWLHLAAASTWVGGLIALSLALRWGRRLVRAGPPLPVGKMVGNFSVVATVCIVVIGVTGLGRALGMFASWDEVLGTPYGNALLVKLGLLVPVLGLAFANHFFLKDRLAGTLGSAVPVGPWRRLILWTVEGEVLFTAAVLAATSVLVALPPPSQAYGSGLVLRGQQGDVSAVVVINPAAPGPNSFDVYVRGASGRPVADAEKVSLIFSSAEQGIGQTEAVASNLGGGHYLVEGSYIAVAAAWQIELLVRQPGQDDVRLDYQVESPQLSAGLPDGHAHH